MLWAGWGREIKNTLIYLTGFPASGKLTIAKALCTQADAILVDNHTINNPILQLVRKSGKQKIAPAIWKETNKIRQIVFGAMIEHAGPDDSFILTNVLVEHPDDRDLYEAVYAVADKRKALFVPVMLKCSESELIHRVTNKDREEKLKLTDPLRLKELLQQHQQLTLKHDNLLEIDTGNNSTASCVQLIRQHVEMLEQA